MSQTTAERKHLSHPNHVGVTSVGFSRGQGKSGVDSGPTALIQAGLLDSLKGLGYEVFHDNKVHSYEEIIPNDDPMVDNMKNPMSVAKATEKLSEQVYEHASKGRLALTLGGDHSIAIGTVSGVARAVRERLHRDISVIWVDAHADINRPEDSDSGNVHGMPLAFLTGISKHKIFGWLTENHQIPTSKLVYIGLRDVDAGEKKIIREHKIKAFSMHDIDRHGIGKVMEMALEYIGKDQPIHLSFDVDALDPTHAPSTGTPVRGGLTLREGDFICETVHETGNLVAVDLVEVNPSILTEETKQEWGAQETVRAGCSLVRCALGETLL